MIYKNSMFKLENHDIHHLPPRTLWTYYRTHQGDEPTSRYLNQQENFCVNTDLQVNVIDRYNTAMKKKKSILDEAEKKTAM